MKKVIYLMFALLVVSCGSKSTPDAQEGNPNSEVNEEDPNSEDEDGGYRNEDVMDDQSTKGRKPKLTGLIVRIAGDDNYSIIDARGNVTARNKIPRITSQGNIVISNWSSPVIDGIFSLERRKSINGEWDHSYAIYKAGPNPMPIDGLNDLYRANVIMPDAFPICKRGEHVKFIDKVGNVLGTVNPVDGKEYNSVEPYSANGMFYVESSGYCGLVNTRGEWLIKPEWSNIVFYNFYNYEYTELIGEKDGKHYLISEGGKVTPWPFLDQFYGYGLRISNDYIFEEVFDHDNMLHISNVYDRQTETYITSINDADYIRPNSIRPEIICARKGFDSPREDKDRLIDISRNNEAVSGEYDLLQALPNGDYLGVNHDGDNEKVWYVKIDGSSYRLPDNTRSVLRHPTMLSLYDTDFLLCVEGCNGSPGYLCDINGNRVGDYYIEEWVNRKWEVEPVKNYFR